MLKSLDAKLADIHANPAGSRAFILADAKDADMAFGMAAPGRGPDTPPDQSRSLAEYRDQIRANVQQGLVDIMLMSVSTAEQFVFGERLFDSSAVTPAIRANDTTDIHAARGAVYSRQPSLPFRTALLDHAICGRVGCDDVTQRPRVDLGLYSLTFNNDAELDRATLDAYRAFREEAERKNFRHFLEVFDPNRPANPVPPELLGGFLNDLIARTLAGVAAAGRPVFLKVVYHGPKFMEELVRYDPHLVVGVLGGSAGTTYDAFKLLAEARKYGARAALFGRKINNAEHQLAFIQFLRWIADGEIEPEEAVAAYHAALDKLGIKPHRPLRKDMELTAGVASYGGSAGGQRLAVSQQPPPPAASAPAAAAPAGDLPTRTDGAPDFSKMTPAQRLAYHRDRLNRHLG